MTKLRLLGSLVMLLTLGVKSGSSTDNSGQPPAEVVAELGTNYRLLHPVNLTGKDFTPATVADLAHDYDVIKYKLELSLAPSELINKLKGHATIQAKSGTVNLTVLSLDLVGLTVDSCKVNSQLATFNRLNGKLNITLNRGYQPGESFTAEVFYRGYPTSGLYFETNKYGKLVCYTFTEPDRSKYWFPCYDSPSDKALSEVICTAQAGNEVISNGVLLDVIKNPNNTVTYHWQETYPIATYLISLAVSDYAQIQDQVILGTDELPLSFWVYPQDSAKAVVDFASTGQMVTLFSELFGEYPFLTEKFSIAQAELAGAMEHQTCVSWGLSVQGNSSNEWIVAHELAHHWWGNLVTCQDFANIWLNEGFATYCEALWKEYARGLSRFKGHMIGLEWHVLADSAGSVKYPIYSPPGEYLFGIAVYRKGAWVMHMLRYLLGNQIFFKGLRSYAETFGYATSTTEQFKAVMEVESGQELDWFFKQWVYQPNFPKYKWSWVYTSFEGKYFLDIYITQEQATPIVFRMPVEFGISSAAKDSVLSLYNSSRYQNYSLIWPGKPSQIAFDPNNWLLGVQNTAPYPATAGDLTGDKYVKLGDVIYLINMIFNRGPRPTPMALADVDGSCQVTLSDVIYLVNFVSGKGPAPKMGCPQY